MAMKQPTAIQSASQQAQRGGRRAAAAHGGDSGLQGGALPRGVLVRIRPPPLHCARPPHRPLQGVHSNLRGRAPCNARRLPPEICMKRCAWH